MKFAFAMPNLAQLKAMAQPWEFKVTGADQTRLAKFADDLGYDMIAIPEHHIIPNKHLELSGAHYFNATAAQAYMAGATKRIRINSAVTILPLQNPIVLAKSLSTIDWFSMGRVTATFGVGWMKKEFEILRVPFGERGRMTDEYLDAMIELWTSDNPSYDGKYVSFKDVAFAPKPVQKPHLPIWMGGDSDPALKRAARVANGWIPFLTKPEKIGERIDFIKSQPSFRGGDFEVMYGMATSRVGKGHVVVDDPKARPGMSAQEIVDRLGGFKEQGVTMSAIPIPPVKDIDAYCDYAQWVIEEIKPKTQ